MRRGVSMPRSEGPLFKSLAVRVSCLGLLVACALAGLVGLLLGATVEMRASFRWVSHSQIVIQTMDETISELREAESGQRGFLLTRDPAFATHFADRTSQAERDLDKLVRLTRDNPAQNARAMALRAAVLDRIVSLRAPLQLGQAGRFDAARAIVASGRGRELMDVVYQRTADMMQVERSLLANRAAAADDRLAWNKNLVIGGGPAIIGLIVLLIALVARGIRRPMRSILSAMSTLGEGDRSIRIDGHMGSSEFDSLARGYNRMADRLESAIALQREADMQLQGANLELRRHGEVLRARGEVIELLGGMAHRMQAARTDAELAAVIQCFVPRVLPAVPGALYAHNNSRNLLVRVADWGSPALSPDGFAPDECWGLRRGQSHFILEPGTDIVCSHVADKAAIYHCEPLLAGGEVIGMLYLEGVVEAESRFRLNALIENIASALVNHRLQRGLREQTIRDPMTGLFNRRYLEETLAIEIARASRRQTPLSVVMCDVDHFKRFNDEFGHDAGDTLLQAVSAEMRNHFRDGDVVCRFGGEEFTIVAPGATPAALGERIERLRLAIGALTVRQAGRSLGSVSMSFGIAGWQDHMARDGSSLIQAADVALYRAKRDGRNRSVLAEQLAA
jgi:diguanylate cyclase (GGDEF)-like protein